MVKIAVFGERESIKGYAAVGLDIYPCDSDAEAHGLFKRVSSADYGVIFITEYFAQLLSKEIEKCDRQLTPCIVPIPGAAEGSGIGTARLKAAVEKAVGSDIIFNN